MAYTELIIFIAMPTCDTYMLHVATCSCNIKVEELEGPYDATSCMSPLVIS